MENEIKDKPSYIYTDGLIEKLKSTNITAEDMIQRMNILNEIVDIHINSKHYKYNPSSYGFVNGLIMAEGILGGLSIDKIETQFCIEPDEWGEDLKYDDINGSAKSILRNKPFGAFRRDVDFTVIESHCIGIRIHLHSLINCRLTHSLYTSHSLTAMVNARLSLGKVLNLVGSKDPYEIASNKRKHQESKEIAPEVDVSDEVLIIPENRIEAVDFIRDELNILRGRAIEIFNILPKFDYNHWVMEWMSEAIKQISYARLYYGLDLGRIRQNALDNLEEAKTELKDG